MRVVHLDAGRELRGGQRQVLELVSALPGDQLLLTPEASPLMNAARERGINAQPMSLMSITSAVRNAALVHAHCARSHTWAAALANCPVVVSRRVAFAPGQSVLSRWKYRQPRCFIAVSEYVRRTLLEAGVPAERVCVVYDGVPIPPESTHQDARLIVAPETTDAMKGSDLLKQASEATGIDIVWSADLARDLPNAALLVYITRSEGLGSAALLALAHGVPVVASRVGGLPEAVEDGVTGVLTENDSHSIGAAIRKALSMRDELAANARRRAVERFSVDRMVRSTSEIYTQVLR